MRLAHLIRGTTSSIVVASRAPKAGAAFRAVLDAVGWVDWARSSDIIYIINAPHPHIIINSLPGGGCAHHVHHQCERGALPQPCLF